jgi:hypothetical protein
MQIIIFKTNIATAYQVGQVHPLLTSLKHIKQYNFDLEDCDHILRVVSNGVQPETVCEVIEKAGFNCEEMESFVYTP